MKSVIASLALIFVTTLTVGCGSSSGGGGGTPPNKSNGAPTSGGVGQAKVSATFLAKAWCNSYSVQGRTNQDRYVFSKTGIVTYQQFELENGERTKQFGETEGTWGTDGVSSQVAISNFVFELSYFDKDQMTGAPRTYLKIDGQWLPFEICD